MCLPFKQTDPPPKTVAVLVVSSDTTRKMRPKNTYPCAAFWKLPCKRREGLQHPCVNATEVGGQVLHKIWDLQAGGFHGLRLASSLGCGRQGRCGAGGHGGLRILRWQLCEERAAPRRMKRRWMCKAVPARESVPSRQWRDLEQAELVPRLPCPGLDDVFVSKGSSGGGPC